MWRLTTLMAVGMMDSALELTYFKPNFLQSIKLHATILTFFHSN